MEHNLIQAVAEGIHRQLNRRRLRALRAGDHRMLKVRLWCSETMDEDGICLLELSCENRLTEVATFWADGNTLIIDESFHSTPAQRWSYDLGDPQSLDRVHDLLWDLAIRWT